MTEFAGHILPRNQSVSPTSSGGTVTGTGVSPEVAYWATPTSLTGSTNLTFVNTTGLTNKLASAFGSDATLNVSPDGLFGQYFDFSQTTSAFGTLPSWDMTRMWWTVTPNADYNPSHEQDWTALDLRIITPNTVTHSIWSQIGLNILLDFQSTGAIGERLAGTLMGVQYGGSNATPIPEMVGASIFSLTTTGSNTITTNQGIQVFAGGEVVGSTIISNIGIEITNITGATITNNYGLLIDDVATGSNNWAIKTGLGKNYFGDSVQGISTCAFGGDGTFGANQFFNFAQTVTNFGGASVGWQMMFNTFTLNSGGNLTSNIYTLNNVLTVKSGNTFNYGTLSSEASQANHFGTGTVTSLAALLGGSQNHSTGTIITNIGVDAFGLQAGTGPITNNYAVRAQSGGYTAGTITTDHSVHILSPLNLSGVVMTTHVGLYLESQNIGTTNYAIFTNLGKIQFGDNVSIGGALSGTVASLELVSTTQGFLPTRMTTTQRNAITAVEGLIVHDTTIHGLFSYQNGSWIQL